MWRGEIRMGTTTIYLFLRWGGGRWPVVEHWTPGGEDGDIKSSVRPRQTIAQTGFRNTTLYLLQYSEVNLSIILVAWKAVQLRWFSFRLWVWYFLVMYVYSKKENAVYFKVEIHLEIIWFIFKWLRHGENGAIVLYNFNFVLRPYSNCIECYRWKTGKNAPKKWFFS